MERAGTRRAPRYECHQRSEPMQEREPSGASDDPAAEEISPVERERIWRLSEAPEAPDLWSLIAARIERHEGAFTHTAFSRPRRKGARYARRRGVAFFRIAAMLVIGIGLAAVLKALWPSLGGPAPVPTVVAVPAGATTTVELAGGIVAHLNSVSSLSYIDNARGVREVELDGEGYFDVRHDPEREFRVRTSAGVIRDLGTAFNVRVRDGVVVVVVTQGRVELESMGRAVLVEAGQQAGAVEGSPPVEPKPADIKVATAWRHGQLIFYDKPLRTVAPELERRYGVRFDVSEELADQRITAAIRSRSAAEAARAVCAAIDARCTRTRTGWSISSR